MARSRFPRRKREKIERHSYEIKPEEGIRSVIDTIQDADLKVKYKIYWFKSKNKNPDGQGQDNSIPKNFSNVVIYGHNLGDSKSSEYAKRFAVSYLKEHKSGAVIAFDLPGHEHVKKQGLFWQSQITMSDCEACLNASVRCAKDKYGAKELFLYAAGFGAFLFMNYIKEYGNPFGRIALLGPIVNMVEYRKNLMKNKFDREIRACEIFDMRLSNTDIESTDYRFFCRKMLILHGSEDELASCKEIRRFAEKNMIRFVPIDQADHRFLDPANMDIVIKRIIEFFDSADSELLDIEEASEGSLKGKESQPRTKRHHSILDFFSAKSKQYSSAKLIRKHMVLTGAVQHVGLRWRLLAAADQTGVTGWVRNDSNGAVTLEIQGTEEQIEQVFQIIGREESIQIKNIDSQTIPVLWGESGFVAAAKKNR